MNTTENRRNPAPPIGMGDHSLDEVFGSAVSLACIRALPVAFVVGTLLTLINQWPALFGDAEFGYVRAALTFLVPFCVSIYGGVTMLKRMRGKLAAAMRAEPQARTAAAPGHSRPPASAKPPPA